MPSSSGWSGSAAEPFSRGSFDPWLTLDEETHSYSLGPSFAER